MIIFRFYITLLYFGLSICVFGQTTESKINFGKTKLTLGFFYSLNSNVLDDKVDNLFLHRGIVNIGLNGIGGGYITRRLAIYLEVPINRLILESSDRYTTLGKDEKESKNQYYIYFPKLNLIYFFRNCRPSKPGNTLYGGIGVLPYFQNPKYDTLFRYLDNIYPEYRCKNIQIGYSILLGFRLQPEEYKNYLFDLHISIDHLSSFLSQNYVFNYFGNATPYNNYHNVWMININFGIQFFIK